LKKLRAFARVFPIGRPRLWLLLGLSEWLSGDSKKARAAWGKSRLCAETLGMRYELGRTHLEIGRHLDPGDPDRPAHLEKAARIFKETGAALERSQARELLGAAREPDGS
jgi:hypothetical protein